MADKRYDQFPAGSNDPAQIILTADPSTGELGKIPLSDLGGSQNLQDVTDVGNETNDTVFVFSASVEQSSPGFKFNLDESGNYKSNGWAGAIKQDSSTGHIIIQPSVASGTTGGAPSYATIPFEALPNSNVKFGGNLQATNYGTGGVTGTPATRPVFDASGNIVELVEPKRYVALLFQSGTNDPTATVLENTLGAIVWTRTSIATYLGTLTGAFTIGKTWLVVGTQPFLNNPVIMFIHGTANTVNLEVQINNTQSDDLFPTNGLSVEIRVYP